ncbi:MAG: HTH domain-containing protein [Candidatus Micrarchaeota archaeon]
MKSSEEPATVVESNFRKRTKPKTRNTKPVSNAGRPNSLDQDKLVRLLEAYYSRPYSFRELADMFGVSRMTVWRAVQDAPYVPAAVMRA